MFYLSSILLLYDSDYLQLCDATSSIVVLYKCLYAWLMNLPFPYQQAAIIRNGNTMAVAVLRKAIEARAKVRLFFKCV